MRRRPGGLEELLGEIGSCRVCVERSQGAALPHEPRPVIRASRTARIAICGQAPGTRVHACGVPFLDPSGDRLRAWMAVTREEFYDGTRVAIVPMGFCFPGLDTHGSDLPPRRECAPLWHDRVLAEMPGLELILLVGAWAQRWHLPFMRGAGMTATVAAWREVTGADGAAMHFPLPHPSWRNNAWIKRNPWFEVELLPALRGAVRRALDAGPAPPAGPVAPKEVAAKK